MIKKLLTTFAVLTVMTTFAMAQLEPILNSGKIVNKGTIVVGCTVGGVSIQNQAAGTIANDATGVIKFTGDNPVFANTNVGNVTNNGTIQFDGLITADVMTGLGTNATTDRVGGIVLYNGLVVADDNQRIQGNVYYTNLTLAGAGLKTFNDTEVNYYVSAGYTASGGTRTYGNSIFHYDGTGPQTIFAETATDFTGTVNYYNNLQLDGTGTKTILTGTSILVSTILGDASTAAVTMAEASKFILKNGINADIAGAITGTGATIQLLGTGTTGTFDVASTGSITFNAGTAASLFEMDGATVTNAGTMTFNAGSYEQKSGTSVHSGTLVLAGGDYNQVAGNVTLSGTTTISSASSVYTQTVGLLTISGTTTVSAGTIDINGTNATNDLVTIATGGTLNLSAVAGTIDMAASTNMLVNGAFISAATTNLAFNPTSTVTYDAGTAILLTSALNPFGNLTLKSVAKAPIGDIFVKGSFWLSDNNLNMSTTSSTLTMLTASTTNVKYGTGANTDMVEVVGKMNRDLAGVTAAEALVFNNYATTIKLTTPGSLSDLTLNVTPGNNAIGGDYLSATDVERSISLEYDLATQTGWVITMAYGYKDAEATGLDQAKLRYREVLDGTTSEKVATGLALIPTNSTATTWGSLALRGIIPGDNTGTLAQVASGDNLFLRSATVTFITISDGRWSNPNTWDEGVQPAGTDNTEIKHTVHVGFKGGSDGTDLTYGVIEERGSLAGAFKLAKSIVIDDISGASLVFGDNPAALAAQNSSSLGWSMATAGIITNKNTKANTPANVDNLSTVNLTAFIANAAGGIYQGLIIFESGTTTGTRPISLKTYQLINTGGEVMVGPNTILQICD